MKTSAPVTPRLLLLAAFVAVGLIAFQCGRRWPVGDPTAPPPAAAAADPAPAAPPKRPAIVRTSIRAEFNPQSALLIGANEMVRYHQATFKEMVRAVHGRLPIVGFVNDEDEAELGRSLLDEAGVPFQAVSFVKHPLNSMWLRDFAPQFTRWSDGEVRIVQPVYNNPDENDRRPLDNALSTYVGKLLHLEVERVPLIIDGGNLLANGDGLMVTSTRVIERPENRGLSLQDIGQLLQKHYGCRTWVYLRPLANEPTGHVDMCMTFLRRNLVVVGRYDPAYDAVNAAILDEMAEKLSGLATSMGPLQVERIPMPPRTPEGDWRSYCNVLLVNGIILVPSYSGVERATEDAAFDTYARLMPSWKVQRIIADSLVRKRGVLHCVGIGIPGYVNVQPLIREAL